MSNPYAVGRLWAALETAARHPDEATRNRAAAKAERWTKALTAMAEGTVTTGSRTPVEGVPAWVTLEVVTGGFATGRLLAEQPPDAAELTHGADRESVNRWYLGDEGQAQLLRALKAERYRIELPEHAALPAVALLLERGQNEAALDLVADLAPFLGRLRFTPTITDKPEKLSPTVHLRPVGAVADKLRAKRTNDRIRAMRATLETWNPLLDDLVDLWHGILNDEPGWSERKAHWLSMYEQADRENPEPTRHRHPKSNFARLRVALEQGLTPRELGWVRKALANTAKHTAGKREEQREQLKTPTHAEIAHRLADDLAPLPRDGGIPDTATILVGGQVPASLLRVVLRALEAPVEELVERGVITSGDVLAEVLPQLTGQVLANGLGDDTLAGLQARTYTAFRRRRGLLLVNLEHQVRFEELPWVRAFDDQRATSSRDGENRALHWAAGLAVSAFPERIVPNPLVAELAALARAAGRTLPLVEEVAADIFMGTFTAKWRDAAQVASERLQGTLYARYYDLPDPAFWAAPEPAKVRWRKRTSSRFDGLCASRAAEAGVGRGVSANGAVIEQSQILTTHNLAVLSGVAELPAGLAERVLTWIAGQRLPKDDRGAHLAVKNLAYAWRQALFHLSLDPEREALIGWFAQNAPDHLRPVVLGLTHVAAGGRFDDQGTTHEGGRRLLGWTVGERHWLVAARRADSG